MNIQSGYGINSYQGADRIGISRLGASTTKSNLADVSGLQGAAASSVSISDAARKLASADGTATQGRTALQQQLIDSAASDPQGAEKLAYDFANVSSQICYDMSEEFAAQVCLPTHKLASTGRFADEAFQEKFSHDASLADAQKKAIYETEKAKGTPAAEIYAKLIDFTNTQSKEYLEGTGWLAQTSA